MEAVGVALAVLPLIISALENYEYTFQPVLIFSHRHRREIERFQHILKAQKADFANECCFLLHGVTANSGNAMIDNLRHPLWKDKDLETQLKELLETNYDACISALSLINTLLTDILKETEMFNTLNQQDQGRLNEWLRNLRQRTKISFSKDRFDDKLRELQTRIGSLRRIRKHIEQIKSTAVISQPTSQAQVAELHNVQKAASRLHEVLSSRWRCDGRGRHYAAICVDSKDDQPFCHSQSVRFELAWTCSNEKGRADHPLNPIRLSVEAFADLHAGVEGPPQLLDHQNELQTSLETSIDSSIKHKAPSRSSPGLGPSNAVSEILSDLSLEPSLCQHLRQQIGGIANPRCVGFLEEAPKNSRHLIYYQCDEREQTKTSKTLEDALKAAKSTLDGIPLPEKLNLAKLLALAVLRYHSTPWMRDDWQSRDVVFLSVGDFAQDPMRMPFLKSPVLMDTGATTQQVSVVKTLSSSLNQQDVRNHTLYSLGIMLLELAYDAPLRDLEIPDDGGKDANSLHRTAARLGDSVWRKLGPKYADVVKICLYCAFGPSDDLDNVGLQERFFDSVLLKLDSLSKAVAE